MYKYSIGELKKLAEQSADIAISPSLFLLTGNLGTGKTTFASFFIKKLAGDIVINSPTFNIVQVYESIKGPIWHIDLYRIRDASELENLGLFEAICQYICLVEWPNLLEPFIKNNKNVTNIDLTP